MKYISQRVTTTAMKQQPASILNRFGVNSWKAVILDSRGEGVAKKM